MREKSLNDHFLRLRIQRTHDIVEQGYIVATVHRTSQGLQELALTRQGDTRSGIFSYHSLFLTP